MMSLRAVACLAVACVAAALSQAPPPTPAQLATSVIARYMALPLNASLKMADLPDYGPAIALSAMYEASAEFGNNVWPAWVSALLDKYMADPKSNAYAVLHNVSVPWGYSVGDDMGLFPIAYLSRAMHLRTPFGVGDDWKLVLAVCEQYVIGWPLRLADGTISRKVGWGPAGNGSGPAVFLWQDDQFMGTALLARVARYPGAPQALARRYAAAAAAQQLQFAGYCQDPSSGLYRHGYNNGTGELSCCSWGRANGWVMMAHAEAAEALAEVDPASPALPLLLDVWRRQATGIARLQAAGDGRFHQVLDQPSTFLETSVTTMTLYSLATGVRGGFLDRATYAQVIEAAWAGLALAVDSDGTVNGICTGTGIGTDVAFYETRPTAYNVSAPGLGSVFRAATAYARYLAA